PAGQLQSILQVLPVAGSEVIELQAVGTQPRLLADLLNTLPDVVRAELATRQWSEAEAQLASTRQELERLERGAAERRARLAAFRLRAGVLADHDDNEAVAQTKGLNQAINVAMEKEAAAAARLAAVTQAVEQGKSSTQARADPALSALETRAHQAREDLKELERTYTADFMAMDSRARALRSRLVELERQIIEQRVVSQKAALQSAQEDHTSAQAQVTRLRAQLGAARPALNKTASQLAEAKVIEEDLAQVERARREVLERVTRLEADEQRRVAKLTVVEAAVVPSVPFRPDHWRDAGIVLLAAALLALAATGTVEVFNRAPAVAAPAASTTLVLAPGWEPRHAQLSGAAANAPALLARMDAETAVAALPAPISALDQPEAAALLAAASGPSRLLCAAGLMGLSAGEALAICPRDLDLAGQSLQVGGPWARRIPIPPWLTDALPKDQADDVPILRDAAGHAMVDADIAAMIISAALDAGIDRAATLNWDTLRNTCIDWLVDQGIRYGDLPKLVGRVDAASLQGLSARHAQAARRDLGQIDLLMPALKLAPAG
ncbi:MAG: hypothetical protein ACRC2B_07455, partial [Rubrivivax sp.]